MSRLPSVHGGGGHAISHNAGARSSDGLRHQCAPRSNAGRREAVTNPPTRSNSDIRPWIQAGEAARLVLDNIEIAEKIE